MTSPYPSAGITVWRTKRAYVHILVTLALTLGAMAPAKALLIFDDGAEHTINTTTGPVLVRGNGTTLNVVEPAAITGDASDPSPPLSPGNAITVGSFPQSGPVTVNVTGGTVSGADRGNGISMADCNSCAVNISGTGVVRGGNGGDFGGRGIESIGAGFTHFSVSGDALVRGGDGNVRGGQGMILDFDALITMDNGEIRGGEGGDQGGDGLFLIGNILPADIRGGVIGGGDGGQVGGAAVASDLGPIDATVSGGEFWGGDGGVTGGSVFSLAGSDGYFVDVHGGRFNAGNGGLEDGWLLELDEGSIIDISGGIFGDINTGRGFLFENTFPGQGSVLNVYGRGLSLTDGLVTGTLLDGNHISVPVVGDLTVNQVNLIEVPEPSTLALTLIGLAGAGFAGTRKLTT